MIKKKISLHKRNLSSHSSKACMITAWPTERQNRQCCPQACVLGAYAGSGSPGDLWNATGVILAFPWRITFICTWIVLFVPSCRMPEVQQPFLHSVPSTPNSYCYSWYNPTIASSHDSPAILLFSLNTFLSFCNDDRLRIFQIFKFWFLLPNNALYLSLSSLISL